MELLYPKGINIIPAHYSGSTMTRHEKIVLHTTEAKKYVPGTESYYGHQLWPHATLAPYRGVWTIFNHLPLLKSSACMRNMSGGVETNRDGCVQIEIAWVASEGQSLPREALDVLVDWMLWVSSQTGIPLAFIDDFHFYPPEGGARLGKEPWRMSGPAFNSFFGVLGHQHATENVHGDPGKIDVQYCKLRIATLIFGDGDEEEMKTELLWFKSASGPLACYKKEGGICKWVQFIDDVKAMLFMGIPETNKAETPFGESAIRTNYLVDGPYKTV